MAIILSGSTNDITIGGVSVATDTEVSSAITDAVTTAGITLKTIATGTATFTATTNNINLTGIGVGVEVGDVIQISGAEDSKNNSEFTIEVITDNDNIIVNQAHANKGTSKNVANRVSDTGVTVKLLAKWYNAPLGLGQDWVDVTANRALNTTYSNGTNRTIGISTTWAASVSAIDISLFISSIRIRRIIYNSSIGGYIGFSEQITKNNNYRLEIATSGSISPWLELR